MTQPNAADDTTPNNRLKIDLDAELIADLDADGATPSGVMGGGNSARAGTTVLNQG